jgi:hypothetical protein
LYDQKQGYVLTSSITPKFAPQMPKEFTVALSHRSNSTISAQAAPLYYSFGILEYLSRQPGYLSQFYSIYKYSRVTAVHFDLEVVGLGAGPSEFIMGVIPFSDFGAITIPDLLEKPGSIRKLVSAAGGMDRIRMRKTCVAEEWIGNPYLTKDYWISSTQAASTTPLDTLEPIMALIFNPLTVSTGAFWEMRTTYHIQFFDLATV